VLVLASIRARGRGATLVPKQRQDTAA